MSDFIFWLHGNQSSESRNAEIGGKAQNLVHLAKAGFNVPEGFVAPSVLQQTVFERHSVPDIIRDESRDLKSEDIATVSSAAKRVRDSILEVEFSEEELSSIQTAVNSLGSEDGFAVRSSGGMEDGDTESWAGQFDSFLNVRAEDVPLYIKHCWASMFGLRALCYGSASFAEKDLPTFSVVVQKMIQGDFSGIAFSVDPVDGNTSHIRIETVQGTGDKAVSGQETPYSVVLGREDGIILKRNFGSQGRVEIIQPSVLRELASTVLKIESLFKTPIDVEWTIKDSEIYILQARPITASQKTRRKSDTDSLPDILDYQLTFKVTGLGFMFADLLCHGFGYLHPLFICHKGEFLQYFTNERMEYAARFGHRWLSTPCGFEEYKQEFSVFHEKSFEYMKSLIGELSATNTKDFYKLVYQYFIRYSKMDFQFTNLTFLYAEENPIIADSLKSISEFKDVARVWVNEISIDDDCLLNQLLLKLSERFAVSLRDMEYYKVAELIDLFASETVPPQEIEIRKNASVAMSDGKLIRYFVGEAANAFIGRVEAIQKAQASADIIGQVANRSDKQSVTGVVRIINVDYGNIEKMEKEIADMALGEILVSEFTAPELMVACQKAKAIVTDLGGMLSHAAIVSREIGIPCVVGTEHASRSLKNGDSVRIDLNIGIVEVIR